MRVLFTRHLSALFVLLWVGVISLAAGAVAVAEERGFLGMQVQGMSPKIAQALQLPGSIGVIVRDISIDGPAAHAGIRRGDVILKMNDQAIETFEGLLKVVSGLKPGDKIAIEMLREGESHKTEMTLSAWPEAWSVSKSAFAVVPELGLTFAAITPKLRDRLGIRWSSTGIVVTVVDNAFSAVSALQRGDIVVQINQKPVWDPRQFLEAYEKAKGDALNALILLVERSDGFKYVIQPIVGDAVEAPVFKLPGQGG